MTFRNVYLYRGPEDEPFAVDIPFQAQRRVTKLKLKHPSGEALADMRTRDAATTPGKNNSHLADLQAQNPVLALKNPATQSTHFHLAVDSIDVSLSLPRWLEGKGLVKEAFIRGVRGVVGQPCLNILSIYVFPNWRFHTEALFPDRSHVNPRVAASAHQDCSEFRRTAQAGDFHLENLRIEDLLLTVYQSDYFRPYAFSIFSATTTSLRKQWLLFDLLSAESITGQVDNCLFSLHRPQSIGRTSEEDKQDSTWKRMVREGNGGTIYGNTELCLLVSLSD